MTKQKNCAPITPAFVWTDEVEGEIFSRIMAGDAVSLILGPTKDDWLPTERTFYRKLASDEVFCQKYMRAREAQAHREFDETRMIADLATPEDVQVARLKIDTRKWRASKLAPKVYGDKTTIAGPGPNGEHVVHGPSEHAAAVMAALARKHDAE